MSVNESSSVGTPSESNALDRYRAIPSVGSLAEAAPLATWRRRVGHKAVVSAAQHILNECRHELGRASSGTQTFDELAAKVAKQLQASTSPKICPVINATGVILHTGLGRAPLAPAAVRAVERVAGQYANVEMDLDDGHRSSRVSHVRDLLCALTGAESATVVNNNAAATLLVLSVVAGATSERRSVIVSRGELIEIGGSFRLPQIMQASGAVLCEVGTTNKTHFSDYEQAIDAATAALLKVHTSNYQVMGFTHAVGVEDLVQLGGRYRLPVIHDIGSGALYDLEHLAIYDEPIANRSIEAGADLVLFSGDKLLGGPQAGIILGSKKYIARIESNPMMRAMRVDKLTLAALEATLQLHRDPVRAQDELPALSMAARSVASLKQRGEQIAIQLRQLGPTLDIAVMSTTAYLGGGSVPNRGIDSIAVRLRGPVSERQMAQKLRQSDPPVVCRVQDGAVWLDLRTILPEQDAKLVQAVKSASAVKR